MKNILLTLATTAALLVGGMMFTDTAEAQRRGWSRGWNGYSGRYYRPSYGYRSYPRYNYGYRGSYGYPGYYGSSYGYPGYYGYGGRYYNNYGSGVYLSTPGFGVYFR